MPLHPTSNLLVVTSHPASWDELAEITCTSHAQWCGDRGYDYHVDRSDLVDKHNGKPVGIRGFIKFDLILKFIRDYLHVVWLDADLVVTNPAFNIYDVFKAHPYNDVILGYDWNSFNSTVICVRSTALARAYLWACNNTGRMLFLSHGWHEMQALKYFSQFPPYSEIVGYESCKKLAAILPDEYEPVGVPRDIMLPYAWEPGDFACHLSALTLERRTALARKLTEGAHV